tara:strand:+ start:83 stop:556 length:474 start_codon:yes stop_codon:yes gene_type:complete
MGKPGTDWSPTEDYILRNEAGLKASKVMELLPGRTAQSIRLRRTLLLSRPADAPVKYRDRWTDVADDQLRELAAQGMNYADIGKLMNRTPAGIKHRMCKLGEFGEKFSFAKEPPPKLDPWPDLGPDAFKNVKVSADPPTTMSRPEVRTLAGVWGELV